MLTLGTTRPTGRLMVKKIGVARDWRYWLRNRTRAEYWKGWLQHAVGKFVNRTFGVAIIATELRAKHFRKDGTVVDLGVLGYRSVTTAYCTFIAAQHQTDSTVIGDYKYHDSGVGTTAENVANTDIETTDGESRATGTQVASTVTYTSVGTIAYTTTKAITEHGLFSASTGATLMDRTVFSAVNVVNGESIQFTYVITFTAGG